MKTVNKQPAFLQGEGPVLLQGAMEMEVRPFLALLKQRKEILLGNFPFWQGKIASHEIVLSRTGIGTAAAAAATALACHVFHPAVILNQGTAGGYGPLEVGDIVLGKALFNGNAVYRDRNGKRYMDLARIEHESVSPDLFFRKPPLLEPSVEVLQWLEQGLVNYSKGKVIRGIIASSDQWNDDPAWIARRQEETGALCEEMEAAAVLMTASQFHVPCGFVRIISNNNQRGLPFEAESCDWLACQWVSLLKE